MATTPTSMVPTVKAQKNALIANSPVFETQFEGASSEEVVILDTEPRYMRLIFTRFVSLINMQPGQDFIFVRLLRFCTSTADLETYGNSRTSS